MSTRRNFLLPIMLALLGGCTGLSSPQGTSPNLYVLDAQPTVPPSPVKRNLILTVNMPQANPGFETSQIAYLRQPHQLNYFVKSRWKDSPTRMLQPLLWQALQQSTGFNAVTLTASSIPADVRLDTVLVRLQQDFTTRPSRVHITLQTQLFDLRTRRVLSIRQFDATEDADAENAYGGVTAANRLVQHMLGDITEFCITATGEK